MSLGLITSAAYVNSEMAAEFGVLPPSFLPAGNTRLFRHQVELLAKIAERVVLTLPESFTVGAPDARLLAELDVEIVRIPDGICLAESVMLAIIAAARPDEALTILHGDTLFLGLDGFPADRFSVHRGEHRYPWAVVGADGVLEHADLSSAEASPAAVVSGLFSFANATAFLKCLSRHKTDFLGALNCYAEKQPGFSPREDAGQWLDFGHLNTYYESRRLLTTERVFNTLAIARNIVTKKSVQACKMAAEAHWFETVPAELRTFLPAYLGRTDDAPGYRLDYEYLCPLNDLFVFGALPPRMWKRILSSCADFLARAREHKPGAIGEGWFGELYVRKTFRRLGEFSAAAGIDLDAEWRLNGRARPSLRAVADDAVARIARPALADCGVMHGDFCFSNILFDFRRGTVKLIDPRGYIEHDRPEIHGDTRYDIGKLHHSIAGKYDMLVAGYFDLSRQGAYEIDFAVPDGERQSCVRPLFDEIVCGSDPALARTADAISILLFLSMLPLHYDRPDRQLAFLANALRLHEAAFG